MYCSETQKLSLALFFCEVSVKFAFVVDKDTDTSWPVFRVSKHFLTAWFACVHENILPNNTGDACLRRLV